MSTKDKKKMPYKRWCELQDRYSDAVRVDAVMCQAGAAVQQAVMLAARLADKADGGDESAMRLYASLLELRRTTNAITCDVYAHAMAIRSQFTSCEIILPRKALAEFDKEFPMEGDAE